MNRILAYSICVISIMTSCVHSKTAGSAKLDFLTQSSSCCNYCIIPICHADKSNLLPNRDTIICCTDINSLYWEQNILLLSEHSFAKAVLDRYEHGRPIAVSNTAYKTLCSDKVEYDESIANVYKKEGISGILSLFHDCSINSLSKENYELFKYIAYLCWDNDIFFSCCGDSEAPRYKWSISGNSKYSKQMKSINSQEQWHYWGSTSD